MIQTLRSRVMAITQQWKSVRKGLTSNDVTVDSSMDDNIHDGILEYDTFSDPNIQAIVHQLKKHPLLVKIIKPVVMPEDFKSAFKCVPAKTASWLSGRGVQYYKACAEGSKDGFSDIMCEVYAAMMTFPIEKG
jgi:hypothetical protein